MRNLAAWMALTVAGALAAPAAQAQDVGDSQPSKGSQSASSAKLRSDSALQQAYRKEFAFLEAEKRALQKRLQEVEESGEAKVRAAEQEVEQLSSRVMGQTMKVDELQEALSAAQRQSDTVTELDDIVQSTLTQASTALEKGGVKLEIPDEPDVEVLREQLELAFDSAMQLLDTYAQRRTVDGSYFGPDGKKVDGKIIHVGQIAAYGVGPVSGALAPAGGDKLKIYESKQGTAAAKALAEGIRPEVLGIFLYESLDKAFEVKKEKTWLEFIASGGVIAWVIVGLGALAALMLLLRMIILALNTTNMDKWVEELAPLVRDGKYDAAAETCEKSRSAPARVFAVTLRNLRRPREELDDLVSEQMLAEAPRLDRFGQMIMVFAAVAPLLGLLGTVTGMISTFDVITEFGTGNPKLLSGGISEALITTQLGLTVAIPALLGGNMLKAWGENIKSDMDRSSLRLTNISYGQQEEGAQSGGGESVDPSPELAPAE